MPLKILCAGGLAPTAEPFFASMKFKPQSHTYTHKNYLKLGHKFHICIPQDHPVFKFRCMGGFNSAFQR
jgi:hypothetical protein